jgi:hypothetical protein
MLDAGTEGSKSGDLKQTIMAARSGKDLRRGIVGNKRWIKVFTYILTGFIQPAVFLSLFWNSASIDDGFAARFLCVAPVAHFACSKDIMHVDISIIKRWTKVSPSNFP